MSHWLYSIPCLPSKGWDKTARASSSLHISIYHKFSVGGALPKSLYAPSLCTAELKDPPIAQTTTTWIFITLKTSNFSFYLPRFNLTQTHKHMVYILELLWIDFGGQWFVTNGFVKLLSSYPVLVKARGRVRIVVRPLPPTSAGQPTRWPEYVTCPLTVITRTRSSVKLNI
jgi:hypothetical protein